MCRGVQIRVTNPASFRPVACYVALVTLAHHAHPEHFQFRTETYEFRDDVPAFDLLTGSALARERILSRDDVGAIVEEVTRVSDQERTVVDDARSARTRSL